MSHIDSYEHELVGYFAGYPVYHVLDTEVDYEPDSDDRDFYIGYRQLVIGGGSGEHPGLVMVSSDLAVKAYVLAVNDDECRPNEHKFNLDESLESELKSELAYTKTRDMVVFAGWATTTHVDFYKLCQSDAMLHPYHEDDYLTSFEDWLLQGFGEFIYFAMPDLAPETVAKFKPLAPESNPSEYNNILLPIPNAANYANQGAAFEMERRNLRETKTSRKDS